MSAAGGGPVAVIGLGSMGGGMAHALVAAGFPVVVSNRTMAKAEPLGRAGAVVATSARAAVTGARVVLLSLADEDAVTDVLFGELSGALVPGTTVVDTTTVSPGFAREAADKLAADGVRRVEACVVGNPQMAAAGRVRVFAAGAVPDVDRVRDVLDAIGQEVRHLGDTGAASVLKLAFNLLLGVQTVALAEAVSFVEAAGLGRELLLTAIENSGWSSPVLGFRSKFMRERDYRDAGFRAVLMHKDLALARAEALEHGVEMPLLRQAVDDYDLVLRAGRGDDDAAVVVEVRPTPADRR
ncbi:NAD(P)-dependent oxidoreductase [Actinosynnema sp. CS-041913]|uniref:NAD(P)-dependent oxidoreductase n=1 Tax=Actinosynnema sp. CS-041913 TaxID=3239917 RepID=UPI003D92F4C9